MNSTTPFNIEQNNDKAHLLQELQQLDELAKTSKFRRLIKHPFKYCFAIFWRMILFPIINLPFSINTNTFFGSKMNLALPAGTDIYLLGGKGHFSEVALASYLIQNLNDGDVFIDVGAHYGYFSLLASSLVNEKGKIISFEPTPSTFKVLEKNLRGLSNTEFYNMATGEVKGTLDFYIFSNLYSEYNTFRPEQFEGEKWYKKGKATIEKISIVNLSEFLFEKECKAKIIKIDVEGAEDSVIRGLAPYLLKYSPCIVMEYLSDERGNKSHKTAADQLQKQGYFPYQIKSSGMPEKISGSIAAHLNDKQVSSDNVLFLKQ
ncbi:MAG: FkbM family methyltransferase [Saprospirales bacterium]|nr:MAG: FkbM family methyltransferase [Saprospirales bacterium]